MKDKLNSGIKDAIGCIISPVALVILVSLVAASVLSIEGSFIQHPFETSIFSVYIVVWAIYAISWYAARNAKKKYGRSNQLIALCEDIWGGWLAMNALFIIYAVGLFIGLLKGTIEISSNLGNLAIGCALCLIIGIIFGAVQMRDFAKKYAEMF